MSLRCLPGTRALSAAAVLAVCCAAWRAHAQTPDAPPADTLPIDLSAALRLADQRNLDIAIFVARIEEASARLTQARTAAVPTVRAGSTYDRHRGNIQEIGGAVIDVHRVARYDALGASLAVDISEAIFRPLAARQKKDAAAAASAANRHRVLMEVATAYLRLVQARAESRLIDRALTRANELAQLTASYAAAGEGLAADAELAAVQPLLIEQRAAAAAERIEAWAAMLARLLHLEDAVTPVPLDEAPPALVIFSGGESIDGLIARALAARPERVELDALVGAAEHDLSVERYGAMIPGVSLGYTSGTFGGAPGSSVGDTDDRTDLTFTLYWQLDQLGLGNRARRNEREAQLWQAGLQRERLRDAIAAEVRESYARVRSLARQAELASAAVERAQTAYELTRTRIHDQQGLPLEALAAMQTLANAELAALDTAASYGIAQLALHTALGNPIDVR